MPWANRRACRTSSPATRSASGRSQLPDPTMKSYFLTIFGRPERVTACACERNGEVTLPQLLHLENGDEVVQKMRAADGRLAKLLQSGKPEADIVEELSLATLSKPPTEAVKAAVRQALSEKGAVRKRSTATSSGRC